jgi:hypothetical protein
VGSSKTKSLLSRNLYYSWGGGKQVNKYITSSKWIEEKQGLIKEERVIWRYYLGGVHPPKTSSKSCEISIILFISLMRKLNVHEFPKIITAAYLLCIALMK